jgi:glycosyltransferase involved in cell wall biosynthesis
VTDVSMVMPCLNEARSLEACIRNAHAALDMLRSRHGLTGEVVVADNGSTDGSVRIAEIAGARIVHVPVKGYGAALIGGFTGAKGRYLVMADADGSYDFLDSVGMVEALMAGADICMGSRFKGTIKRGAMPWKNRYIGNPILTGILNVLFRARVSDAHCGIRALSRSAFSTLRLEGRGMEFASEMLIKASLLGLKIAEAPATLSPDLRGGPPHLRPWRDGWRHLRYLLMLSPYWVFAVPALLGIAFAGAVLLISVGTALFGLTQDSVIGNYWVILAGALLCLSHEALIMGIAGQIYGIREGYRRTSAKLAWLRPALSLERMLVSGLLSVLVGGAILAAIVFYWSATDFQRIANVLPAVLGTTFAVLGVQNVLGGFLLAIVAGNDADFFAGMARGANTGGKASPTAGNAGDEVRSNV